ncbi:Alpha/beta hydrolase fold-1 [Paraphoma chrysanthemicola]|uniref:Alpha/beta hydrolase fold-1 n=1 Tax=Paraphoma chrysanthemicola TaxID=798071 RepID=A0A8K0R6G0_9PLEO|nr:Alpha/beta hydrolase fold-1 [Paraphoma chrysanthemicola]
MSDSTPVVLLIPGGWHTPQSYDKLTHILTVASYDVHVHSLPSMNGSRPPNADLASDTDHIRSVAKSLVDDGHEVVVLMHSYGGQIGTNALHGLGINQRKEQGLSGGVTHLIYLAAHVAQEGKAMIDGVKHFNHEHLMPLAFDFADDMTCVSRDPKALLVGETDLSAVEVDEYLATFGRWNGQAMYQPLSTPSAAWREIPLTYIHTTKDMTVPFEYQKWFVQEVKKQGVRVQTTTIETGHCANFTAAEDVADTVIKVAKGQLQNDQAKEAVGTNKHDVEGAILKNSI